MSTPLDHGSPELAGATVAVFAGGPADGEERAVQWPAPFELEVSELRGPGLRADLMEMSAEELEEKCRPITHTYRLAAPPAGGRCVYLHVGAK